MIRSTHEFSDVHTAEVQDEGAQLLDASKTKKLRIWRRVRSKVEGKNEEDRVRVSDSKESRYE